MESNLSTDGPASTDTSTDCIASPADYIPPPTPWDVLLINTLTNLTQPPTHATNPSNPDDVAPLPLYTPQKRTPSGSSTSSPVEPELEGESPTTTLTNLLTKILTNNPTIPTLLSLPLTTYPPPLQHTWNPHLRQHTASPSPLTLNPSLTDADRQKLYTVQRHIIAAFYRAITLLKDSELVTLFVTQGLVSPDVPDATGKTPLIAAVEAGSGGLVCTLMKLGAQVNGWGTYHHHHHHHGSINPSTMAKGERTALMVAAARGNLALVRLLVEDFGADDALVAPDGQLALRLAAEGAHREVVAYLPVRRGGAWRRWRTHHAVAVRRIKRAVGRVVWFGRVVGWYVPKFVVWDVPKHVVVKPLGEGCKWCWENKHRFGGWCKRQVVEFPGRVKKAGKAMWEGVKKVPKEVWGVVKEIPGFVKRLVKGLWKVVKQIPAAMKKVCVWVWESLKSVGQAVGRIFLRAVAALHTAVAAVLDFFRNIKLNDVWNGVCDVVEAIFCGLPRAIWKAVSSFGSVLAGIVIKAFGFAGEVVVFLIEALWYVVKYVPRQLGEIISGIWGSMAKGYHEIMVWINPKH